PAAQLSSTRSGVVKSESTVLSLKNFRSGHTGPLTIDVGRGEIVGLFGLLGSGRTDLMETLAGIRRQSDGAFKIEGREIVARTPYQAIRDGIGFVASARNTQGVYAELSAEE